MATTITLGQFSSSPIVAAARHLGLDKVYDLDIQTTRVPSSPGQFEMLLNGDIDVAVTSPDNVLLYATTDRNPLARKVDVRMIRAIDRGLGLTLVTTPEIETSEDLAQANLCVDVVRSGFALLLFTMLDRLGIDYRRMAFEERGSTPTRKEALLDGVTDGTILNAESLVIAQDAGMKSWMTASEASRSYLGTVLAVPSGATSELTESLLAFWSEATAWLLDSTEEEVSACLSETSPVLGRTAYIRLLTSPDSGLARAPEVTLEDLRILCDIRRARGAYAPNDEQLPALVRT